MCACTKICCCLRWKDSMLLKAAAVFNVCVQHIQQWQRLLHACYNLLHTQTSLRCPGTGNLSILHRFLFGARKFPCSQGILTNKQKCGFIGCWQIVCLDIQSLVQWKRSIIGKPLMVRVSITITASSPRLPLSHNGIVWSWWPGAIGTTSGRGI